MLCLGCINAISHREFSVYRLILLVPVSVRVELGGRRALEAINVGIYALVV